jgi:hypothetical protein
MSGRVGRKGKRIAHTIAFLLRCPGSSKPEAMWLCKYLTNKSINPVKQWWFAGGGQIKITINQQWWQTADAWQAMEG